ncbi:MAG TPA: hypothetical protein PK184_00085 [Phycisphaerae bacterium]|nr:hypothetical protein [Phycisphaerae bacterium]HXK87149.1 hypothetical protein [Phycisphaerae bacterium]
MTSANAARQAASTRPGWTDLAGMFWLCFASLLFELTCNRVMFVQHYGHLGYVVIGTALFGFALAGVLYACSARVRAIRGDALVPACALLAALFMGVAYLVISFVPLDFTQFFRAKLATLAYLACWYVALTMPFFFVGLAIVSLLGRDEGGVGWLYGADLIGAGLGAVLSVPAIGLLGGAGAIWAAAAITALSAVVFAWKGTRPMLIGATVTTLVTAALGMVLAPRVGIIVHAPKRGFLQDRDAGRIIRTGWSSVSRIDVAEHDDHRMIWFDGGSMQSHMFPWSGQPDRLPESLPEPSSGTLPYALRPREHALVIAASGGKELLWALKYNTKRITAVELDPVVCDFVRGEYDAYLGGVFNLPNVTLINEEGRSFVRRSRDKYDVIQQNSAYAVGMVSTGAAAGMDSYLVTVEAIRDYLEHLTDEGVLCISRENGVRLFTTALHALESMGLEPRGRLYLERALNTYNNNLLLVRKTPFPREELSILADHVRATDRTVLFAPDEFYSILGADWAPSRPDPNGRQTLETIASLSAARRDAYYRSLPYVAEPATDDRPFYNRVTPILSRLDPDNATLPAEHREMAIDARKFGPIPVGDLPPVAVLGEAVLLAALVILLPLRLLGRVGGGGAGIHYIVLAYFSMLGVGFIALEVILLQRYILFLGSPAMATATVLGSLLVFAGLGSTILSPWVARDRRLGLAVFAGIGLIAFLYATGLEALFAACLKYSLPVRLVIGVLLMLPLGLLLGTPFPAGLRYAHRLNRRVVAWAWALNGYMTVIGTTGIAILIQFLGYRRMFLLGGAMYILAGICFLALSRRLIGQAQAIPGPAVPSGAAVPDPA